jgi:hypothetical protein
MDQCRHELWTHEGAAAVRLAGAPDGGSLASALMRAWPVEQAMPFDELLRAIDSAEGRASADARHFS